LIKIPAWKLKSLYIKTVSETALAPPQLQQKLAILADAAKYDASCSSSGTAKRNSIGGKGIGSTEGSGICHSLFDEPSPPLQAPAAIRRLAAPVSAAPERISAWA
jgi:hypothetical protein